MTHGQRTAPTVTVGHTIYAFKDGGMERGLLNIVNYGDHERFRHVILCLTEAGAFGEQLRSPNCEVVEFHKRPGNDWRVAVHVAAASRRRRVDLLHARGWPTLVETALAARLAGIRATVYGFHGKTIQDLQHVDWRKRWVQRIVIRGYQRVVTLNQRMRSDLGAECALPEARVRIIPNGVDTDSFRPREEQQELRLKFGVPIERFVIGNVARLDPVKNHAVTLRALCRLREAGLMPFFLLVGEGPHRTVVEREVKRLGLATDVCLFGYSDHVPELMNCMDVYVQSSLYEGFSNTVIEAMACGLPVVATGVGGTPDLFVDGQEGWLFQPEDDKALASLIARLRLASLRRAMGERARRHVVESFSVQAMVRNYESMYLDLATWSRRWST